MSRFVFKLPDLGEGTVSAEIVSWLVKPGDAVNEGQPIAEMSTEKAVVELPAPVTGRVVSTQGSPGDAIAVGAELAVFDSEIVAQAAKTAQPAGLRAGAPAAPATTKRTPVAAEMSAAETTGTTASRVMASPATRRRAREAGVDLASVAGSGAGGRIAPRDLDTFLASTSPGAPTAVKPSPASARRSGTEEIKVIGVRRVIAQRMAEAKRTIPHFSYVEEVDVTELEALREHLNAQAGQGGARLSPLPFIVAALTRVLIGHPGCNAHYDAARETVVRHGAVHVGVATQTRDGLKVPVVRHAESLSLRQLAAEIQRVTEAARTNRATKDELSGSTITVTSLGKLGGIVSTPVINAPEVAIVGVNRIVERPVVVRGAVAVRQMMNLSSSFDHRFVDGYDAAAMIQSLRNALEHPATIFIQD